MTFYNSHNIDLVAVYARVHTKILMTIAKEFLSKNPILAILLLHCISIEISIPQSIHSISIHTCKITVCLRLLLV